MNSENLNNFQNKVRPIDLLPVTLLILISLHSKKYMNSKNWIEWTFVSNNSKYTETSRNEIARS